MIWRSMLNASGMRLLDFVEQDHRVRLAPDRLGQLTTLFVADVAWRRTDQAGDRVALHELGHVDLDQVVFGAKHELGQRLGDERLADTGRAQEDERADRALRDP